MTPATYNFQWVRGTTDPFSFRLLKDTETPATFTDVRLSVYNKKGTKLAFRATVSGDAQITANPATGACYFKPTPEQTRSLTPDDANGIAQNRYEVEVRSDDGETVWLWGAINAVGGLNDDDEETVV